jgi:hypothetical protein
MRYLTNTRSQKQLIDRLVGAYIDWLEACTRVNNAYHSWKHQTGPRESSCSPRLAFVGPSCSRSRAGIWRST